MGHHVDRCWELFLNQCGHVGFHSRIWSREELRECEVQLRVEETPKGKSKNETQGGLVFLFCFFTFSVSAWFGSFLLFLFSRTTRREEEERRGQGQQVTVTTRVVLTLVIFVPFFLDQPWTSNQAHNDRSRVSVLPLSHSLFHLSLPLVQTP